MAPPFIKPPTMADVARLAGVSAMTVSRAFRGESLINIETRKAILAAADRLGYVVDTTASSFRSQRTDFVALTIPSLNNANFAGTVAGLTDALASRGMQVLLGATNYDMAEEERLIEGLLRRRPRAIVVTGGRHTTRGRSLLARANIPVVETWDKPSRPIGHSVGFSNARAVRGMVDHFVASGYRRIAFIGGDTSRDTRGGDRRRGFVAALNAHGLDATRLVAAGPPPISMREGARAMARLLTDFPQVEAVICVSDLSAFGALTECRRRKVDVPGSIALGGFGNYEIGGICVPTLTTIDACCREIGERAGALLFDILDGREAPRHVAVSPQLILRESSRGGAAGPVAADTDDSLHTGSRT